MKYTPAVAYYLSLRNRIQNVISRRTIERMAKYDDVQTIFQVKHLNFIFKYIDFIPVNQSRLNSSMTKTRIIRNT